jgi:glycosyltransferase involved in cell wall biosynthesis
MHSSSTRTVTDCRPSNADAVDIQVAVEPQRKRICIVTNAPISQNPRVVKEADALSASGYDVLVLFAQSADWTRPHDQRILDRATWRGRAIEVWPGGTRRRFRRLVFAMRVSIFRILAKFSMVAPIAELAYSRFLSGQLWFAVRARADLYIGHNPQSLPVVAWAAHLTGAKFGFDFEDFHQGELPTSERNALSNRLLAAIEARHLRHARLITAASWGIASEVAKVHGFGEPLTVLNVFKWADRAQLLSTGVVWKKREHLSLYWFSQIISLDRGLQDVIQAMEYVREPIELHIRGAATAEVTSKLKTITQRCGVDSRVIFHDPIPPEDLLASATEHDVGLCLEVPTILNRDVCITNKMFLYMLAGLAVIASRTRGHADVLAISPDAGFLYEPGDAKGLATVIERLARDCDLLTRTKVGALTAARERWNWERESKVLVSAVARVV